MATKIGVGNVLGSYAQSAGWKLLNQFVNSGSRFGIFDQKGNPFYESGLHKTDIHILDKTLSFSGAANGPEAGMVSLSYNKGYSITTAPVEKGKVISVNMVENPRTGQVTYVSTGTEKQRKLFEDALERVERSLDLYILHTAERLIERIKIIGHSVNRSASRGTQLVNYQINFQEIIPVPVSKTIQNAVMGNNDSQSQGAIEPQDPKGNQKQAANKIQA